MSFYTGRKLGQKKRAIASEKETAKLFNGRTQINSGALRHAKGDVITKTHLIDDKFTDAESYSLKASVIQKIRAEAFQHRKTPMLRVSMKGAPTVCVILQEDMLILLNNQK